jgi:dolichyl-phosphate-mannose-protein mannosyltransferase
MTRTRFYLGAGGIVLLAALLRLFALGFWRQLLFDESYYVKDAISLRLFGAEMVWRKGANAILEAGTLPKPENTAELISHPPLAKWLISLGFDWFGPADPMGWRTTSAIAGILVVILTIAVARLIFEKDSIALLAGLFVAVDGTAVMLSRVAMLDGFLTLFVLLAWWLYLRAFSANHPTGWLVATGVALGAAASVKWSGLWFAVALILFAAVRTRQRWSAIWRLSVPAVITYLLSWVGWWFGSTGLDRNFGGNPIAAFIKLHIDMFNYNIAYRSTNKNVANAWQWLTLEKPTLFAVDPHSAATAACQSGANCKVVLSTLGNPLIWWLGVLALVVLAFELLRRSESRGWLALVGFAAGWLPWLIFTQRSAFQFYAVAFQPFLAMALAWALPKLPARRLAIVTAAIVLLSFLFLPYQLGTAQPDWYWALVRWLPGWQ